MISFLSWIRQAFKRKPVTVQEWWDWPGLPVANWQPTEPHRPMRDADRVLWSAVAAGMSWSRAKEIVDSIEAEGYEFVKRPEGEKG